MMSLPAWAFIVYVNFDQGTSKPTLAQFANGQSGTISITATVVDPSGASARQTFSVKVSRPPTASDTISDQNVNINENTVLNNLQDYFEDGDDDTLTYTASSSDTSKATVSVSDTTLTLTGIAIGTATITLTGTDFARVQCDPDLLCDGGSTQPRTDNYDNDWAAKFGSRWDCYRYN